MWTVIIPAYNEEARIGSTIGEVSDYLKEVSSDSEILVVDDGSTDRTADIAGSHPEVKLLRSEVNRGKGWAVREGMKNARGDVVMFTDADLSTPIEEAGRLYDYINRGYDVAVGSRMVKPRFIKRFQPPHRLALGQTFGLVVRLLFGLGIKDTQCGFKMFTSEAAKKLSDEMTVDGYTFDVEMLALASRMGLKTTEVPVIWRDMPGSKLSVRKDFGPIIRELARTRRRLKSMDVPEEK